jgi:hypothetical protein
MKARFTYFEPLQNIEGLHTQYAVGCIAAKKCLTINTEWYILCQSERIQN